MWWRERNNCERSSVIIVNVTIGSRVAEHRRSGKASIDNEYDPCYRQQSRWARSITQSISRQRIWPFAGTGDDMGWHGIDRRGCAAIDKETWPIRLELYKDSIWETSSSWSRSSSHLYLDKFHAKFHALRLSVCTTSPDRLLEYLQPSRHPCRQIISWITRIVLHLRGSGHRALPRDFE